MKLIAAFIFLGLSSLFGYLSGRPYVRIHRTFAWIAGGLLAIGIILGMEYFS